jgi:hypothetical protein
MPVQRGYFVTGYIFTELPANAFTLCLRFTFSWIDRQSEYTGRLTYFDRITLFRHSLYRRNRPFQRVTAFQFTKRWTPPTTNTNPTIPRVDQF